MADFVGAIDQGTTSTRFMIFDHAGSEVGRHQLEHEQILPQAGWVEHDPLEIWERTSAVIETAPDATRNLRAADLAAIGITNQRETTVVWDRAHRPAVLQRDRLAGHPHRPDRLRAGPRRPGRRDPAQGRAAAGHVLLRRQDPVDPGERRRRPRGGRARRRALRQHRHLAAVEPHRRRRRRRPRHRRDQRQPHDADGPGDARLGRRAAVASSTSRGRCCRRSGRRRTRRCTARPARNGPFAGEVPLAGDLGDQQAATVGQVCFAPGEAKNTYGTGNFLLLNTGTELVRSKSGLLTTVCYQFGDEPPVYALEGSIAVTGSAVQWLRDQLRHHLAARRRARRWPGRSTDNGGVYFVPAFSGLFAPYWRSDARGAIVGLSRFNTDAHLARATLEAICYQTADVVDAMRAGLRRHARRAQGRRRRHRQRTVHADAGRHPRCAGRAGRWSRRPPRWAPPTPPVSPSGSGVDRRAARQLAARTGAGSRSGPTSSAPSGYAGWKKAVERTLDWVDVD